MNYKHSQKGISLMFAIFILTFTLGITLGTSTILVRQMKIMREIGYSAVAFFAADSGIEKILYEDRKNNLVGTGTISFTFPDNGASYDVEYDSNGDTTIKSTGTYQNTKRAIEIQY